MDRRESIVVGLVLGSACPMLAFVAFWWTTAAVHMHFPRVPLEVVIASAFTGLALGILLDIVYLKRWIGAFYTADVRILAVVYLGLSAVAVASFMGLPVGIFLLGIGSGVYAGRRQYFIRKEGASTAPSLHATAIFAGLVTAAAALCVGFLAIGDRSIRESLEGFPVIGRIDLQGIEGVALVVGLCAVLFVAQYWGAKAAGRFASTIGGKGSR